MNLRVPDTLTSANSGKYTVSIRLWPGGLSFAGLIPAEKDSFFYTETVIDKSKSYLASIKDIFFALPCLTFAYQHINVICANRQYTLTPATIFAENQQKEMMSFVFSSPDAKTLHERLDELDCEILFGIQPEVHEFLSHTFLRPVFTHAITLMLNVWRNISLTAFPKQLYVALHENTMDTACFYRENLLFVNSFQFDDPADIIYYILYIWKQTGLDQQKDKLVVYANIRLSQAIQETIQTYLLQTEFVQPQLTGSGLEVPPDITALFKCES